MIGNVIGIFALNGAGVGLEVGAGVGLGVEVGDGVGVGDGVDVGVGVEVGATLDCAFQINLFPTLTHWYLTPAEIVLKFNLLHAAFGLIEVAAIAGVLVAINNESAAHKCRYRLVITKS